MTIPKSGVSSRWSSFRITTLSTAKTSIPAADLPSRFTAGKEASGTGNMKFSMNGALTIGTLNGANIEIREEVGSENFFLFGLTADQVNNLKLQGYDPRDYYHRDAELKNVVDVINSGLFATGTTGSSGRLPIICSITTSIC